MDGQLVSGDQAYFLGTDVWAPSWTVCERERVAPDVFFSISNVSLPAGHTAKFSSTCVLAVASDLDLAAQARQGAEAIAITVQAVVRGTCVRPWGRSTDGGVSFSDAINDLAILGLFKLGPVHVQEPALSMFEGNWLSF